MKRPRRSTSPLWAPLALLLGASVLSAAPAHAGRASACKAPPLAVPKETQRAVDAAIDARVTGTGAGAVSSSVETRTDYETTTLSQDAAARSWADYSLCLKLAKKLISQELHDELLRALLTPLSGPSEIADPASVVSPDLDRADPAPNPPVETLAGTWQVTSTYSHGSCAAPPSGRVAAYAWLVSVDSAGVVHVEVQGRTSYPTLEGSWAGGHLRVGGPALSGGAIDPVPYVAATEGRLVSILPRADFDLTLDDSALVGTRQLASWSSRMSDDGTGWLIEPCVLHYEVRATR